MYSLGQDPSEEELDKMMSALDQDGDQKIDWKEFETKMGNKMGAESSPAVQCARPHATVLRSSAGCVGCAAVANGYASRWQGGVQHLRQGWQRPDLSAGAAARHDEPGRDSHKRGG